MKVKPMPKHNKPTQSAHALSHTHIYRGSGRQTGMGVGILMQENRPSNDIGEEKHGGVSKPKENA